MAGGYLPFGLAPSGDLTAYTPTLRERATDWLRTKLFTDDRAGQERAGRMMDVAEIPFGFATDFYDAGREAGMGNYGTAGTIAAMAMIPGFHGSPARNLKKLERKNGRNPIFLAVDNGTPRPREYSSGYAGESGQLYRAQFDDTGVLDARTPEGRSALVAALDDTYLFGGEAYLAEKGVGEGQLPGWDDDMLFRSLEKAGHKGALINERPDVVSVAIFDPSIISDFAPFGLDGPAPTKGIRAFHGSPHDFDRFDMSKIGTGEGAQAYGHGLYFAESESVAQGYKNALAPGLQDGALRAAGISDSALRSMRQFTQSVVDPDVALRDWLSWNKMKETPEIKSAFMHEWNSRNPGRMYEVQINADPDTFLDWDKPLSEQQEAVRNALPKLLENAPTPNKGPSIRNRQKLLTNDGSVPGDIIWNNLGGYNYPDETRKKFLEAGIPGIKYLDAGSRGSGDGTRNYVVFDDKLVSIVRKYGIAGASAMLGYNILDGMDEAQAAELKRIEGNQ